MVGKRRRRKEISGEENGMGEGKREGRIRSARRKKEREALRLARDASHKRKKEEEEVSQIRILRLGGGTPQRKE